MSVRPATAGINGLSLPGGKMPAGAPAPTSRPIRLRPWAMICLKLAIYWSGLWTLTVIARAPFIGATEGDAHLRTLILTFKEGSLSVWNPT
jgi:hypothetical protein